MRSGAANNLHLSTYKLGELYDLISSPNSPVEKNILYLLLVIAVSVICVLEDPSKDVTELHNMKHAQNNALWNSGETIGRMCWAEACHAQHVLYVAGLDFYQNRPDLLKAL